jgi:hypothetical protein
VPAPAARPPLSPLITGAHGGHDIDLRRGDQAFDDFRTAVDDYLPWARAQRPIDKWVEPYPPSSTFSWELGEPLDLVASNVGCIVWATG